MRKQRYLVSMFWQVYSMIEKLDITAVSPRLDCGQFCPKFFIFIFLEQTHPNQK